MTRQDLAEKRRKDRRENESSRRPPIEPVIASPRLKRPRDDEGAWIRAKTIPGRAEVEKSEESGAQRAAYRVKEKPGKPSRSAPPSTRSTPRPTPWSQDNMLPTLDMFPRSILAGVAVTDLFPSMRAFKMKPNMMARYYVDDVRILEKKEGPEKKDDENRGTERGDPEGQMKPRPSGSGIGTPKRKDRVVAMMGNSPKINTYFVKKEQAEGVTRDMRMSKVTTTKNEKNAVKPEQVEGLAGAMKMTQDITFKHEKHAEYKDDLEVKTEFGEYFEDYKGIGEQLKMEPGQSATKEVAEDSSRDEVMDMVTDLEYREETRNMTTPETMMENETQSEEHDSPRPTGLEVGTEQVAASEVAAWSATNA